MVAPQRCQTMMLISRNQGRQARGTDSDSHSCWILEEFWYVSQTEGARARDSESKSEKGADTPAPVQSEE